MNEIDISNKFINLQINNIKGISFKDRFIDILSDPSNLCIKRVKNAGKIEDGNIILHNGIKVNKNCYYGDFSKILELNGGCHEPSEERLFSKVLEFIPNNGTMIELGSYWAFYSIWFNKIIKNANNYCIEPDIKNLEVGKNNCKINNVNADFTNAFIGNKGLKITNFIKDKKIDYIDILHSDIQGSEYEMLCDIVPLLDLNKIRYLFISTHSNDLHYKCIELLKKHNYRIIGSADYETETFCFDGIIVACKNDNLDIPFTPLGNRKHTQLRHEPFPFIYY